MHIAVLEVLARRVLERREKIKESLAAGQSYEAYLQDVGRARECKVLLEQIEDVLNAARKGDLDEGDDDADIEDRGSGRRRPATRKPHR